jgi:multicomponent Na+:H+ antiporter subunit B
MKSVILQTALKFITPLLLIFSFYLLLRGHNEPGGGFTGGLVAAAAYSLYVISHGSKKAQELLKVEPVFLIGIGLLIALASGMIGMFFGFPFLTGIWSENTFPIIGKLGTPLIFDIGVYLVVLGIVTKVMFVLSEETNP